MGFLDYIKKHFLSKECEEEEGQLLSKEPLQHSDDYSICYNKWIKTKRYEPMLKEVIASYDKKRGCPSKRDKAICFLMIPTINGFTIRFDKGRWEEDDFKYFVEYLRTKLIQEFGYDKTKSNEEKIQYKKHLETVERHCLKSSNEELDYSHVLIRLCFNNNRVSTIKFCATCAIGKKPKFKELLQKIAEA